MKGSPISAIFAYGTLKRGQEREIFWPRRPQHVFPARVRGELYDLGPFPALLAGSDWVSGECWVLTPDDMMETLRVLDEEEGYAGRPDDLYRREATECWDQDGQVHRVFAYFLADRRLLTPEMRILPNAMGECSWPVE